MASYLSLFSGAGGFEHPETVPLLVCESDAACARILKRRIPQATYHSDVRTLEPPSADFVVGGWPCQDISSAGNLAGLDGKRSGLFFDMVSVAQRAGAHTIVGENVPNLLTVNKGKDFERLITTLVQAGFPYISWRTLSARQFGLPQERNRVFVVASKHREFALSLHTKQPNLPDEVVNCEPKAAGFYWTAGGRSICFSRGYTPALKIGASDGKGRSVVAIFKDGILTKLSADACARLQGFDPEDFVGESKTDIVRMAGNAVPLPMGEFVLSSVFACHAGQVAFRGSGIQLGFNRSAAHGFYEDSIVWTIEQPRTGLANNLDEHVATDAGELLSGQAAAGLIVRSVRSGKPLPPDLFDALWTLSKSRDSYRGSRSNSFEILDSTDVKSYRDNLIEFARKRVQPLAAQALHPDLFAS